MPGVFQFLSKSPWRFRAGCSTGLNLLGYPNPKKSLSQDLAFPWLRCLDSCARTLSKLIIWLGFVKSMI